MKITVVGSGGWGTALALLLVENGHDVTLWSHRPEKAEELRRTRENPMLKGVTLPEAMHFTADLACVADCGAVLMVTPSYAVRETAAKLRAFLRPGTVVISASKGIEKSTSLRLSQVIEEELEGKCPVVVLSGPSHAEEVGRHIPTGVVAAADRLADAELVQDLFMNKRFRVYTSDDRIGTEICAALKNVIALCAGCTDGMGCGDNTKALLMTRGLAEMARLGVALGGRKDTFTGLAGVGDLIVTCTSMHSRNRRCGILIGQGMYSSVNGMPIKMVRAGRWHRPWRRSARWWRATTPPPMPGPWPKRPGWRCPFPRPPMRCCTRAGTPSWWSPT